MGNSSAAHMATANENVHNHKLKMEQAKSIGNAWEWENERMNGGQ